MQLILNWLIELYKTVLQKKALGGIMFYEHLASNENVHNISCMSVHIYRIYNHNLNQACSPRNMRRPVKFITVSMWQDVALKLFINMEVGNIHIHITRIYCFNHLPRNRTFIEVVVLLRKWRKNACVVCAGKIHVFLFCVFFCFLAFEIK